MLSILLFAALFAIPLLPGLREVRRPRDDRRLEIPREYTREPRYFGRVAREEIATLLDDAPATAVRVAAGSREVRDVLGRGDVAIGERARLGNVYAGGRLSCGSGTTIRAACSDGEATLGEGSTVERWIDAAGALRAERGCDLGISAASGTTVELGPEVRFGRVYGSPIAVASEAASDDVVLGAGTRRLESTEGDVVERAGLAVAPGATIAGSLKAYGSISIAAGARVTGNVISRADVHLGDGAAVDGHVFAEGSVRAGRGVRIGTSSAQKTAFAGRSIRLGGDTVVHGWIVCDGLGATGS